MVMEIMEEESPQQIIIITLEVLVTPLLAAIPLPQHHLLRLVLPPLAHQRLQQLQPKPQTPTLIQILPLRVLPLALQFLHPQRHKTHLRELPSLEAPLPVTKLQHQLILVLMDMQTLEAPANQPPPLKVQEEVIPVVVQIPIEF